MTHIYIVTHYNAAGITINAWYFATRDEAAAFAVAVLSSLHNAPSAWRKCHGSWTRWLEREYTEQGESFTQCLQRVRLYNAQQFVEEGWHL